MKLQMLVTSEHESKSGEQPLQEAVNNILEETAEYESSRELFSRKGSQGLKLQDTWII